MAYLQKFIGKIFQFRYRGMIIHDIFKGIGNHEKSTGMMFSHVIRSGIKLPNNITVIIHPSRTKCIIGHWSEWDSETQPTFLALRQACRNELNKRHIKPTQENIYKPTHQVCMEYARV